MALRMDLAYVALAALALLIADVAAAHAAMQCPAMAVSLQLRRPAIFPC
jgi:hypothetical protein